ncbi:MAG TPA: tRNA (guanosine(37)-N1)-methyltransferase TrmD [Candidatus Babeliales bacterium]|nr:tRNA (guanosine(37)-N1)-methyltransferase TrmD [Candidatus Babeliales bacterium]
MQISILTLFPNLYQEFLGTSLVGRAREREQIKFDLQSLFQFCQPKQRIDSPTFGHSSGMLLKPEMIEAAIIQQEQKFGPAFKIFLSPKGKKLDQQMGQLLAQKLQAQQHLLFVAARYEGIDARVEQVYADLELSIGDYVLMGGDLPAMVTIETLLRNIPGVIGKSDSVELESFSGPFVEYPEYTAPVVWHDLEVPAVLRSGNHAAIASWRAEQAAERTVKHNFGWLRSCELSESQKQLAKKYIPPHYVVLMHDQVVLKDSQQVGTSSVTSLDLHDIARSAATYGIKNYYIVTPLVDQQRIVQTLLDFWNGSSGIKHNIHRHIAVSKIKLKNSLEEVLQDIYAQEQVEPVLVSTSAKASYLAQRISYFDQEIVWQRAAPVLLLFGTACGLSSGLLERSDFILGPVMGFSDFNHLSVRSATAIVLDRWLGLQPKSQAQNLTKITTGN